MEAWFVKFQKEGPYIYESLFLGPLCHSIRLNDFLDQNHAYSVTMALRFNMKPGIKIASVLLFLSSVDYTIHDFNASI